MSWQDRLQPEITLQSPSGILFTGTWKGNPRSIEKRLGIFEYPKIPGALIQDMGVGPVRYPISFYLDGDDHDLDSARFFDACKEVGYWAINHPTLGMMLLQLMTVTEEIQPVESAGVTLFTTEWIEPMDGGMVMTVPQLEEWIADEAQHVEAKAAVQADKNVQEVTEQKKSGAGAIQTPATFASKVMDTVKQIKDTIDRVKSTVNGIRSAIDNVYRSVVNTVQGAVMSVVSLAGGIQSLISMPGEMTTDLASRFNFYGTLMGNSLNAVSKDKLDLTIKELVSTSCIVGMSRAVVGSKVTSREEAVQAIDTLNAYFNTLTAGLDAGQVQLSGESVTRQYFSQSESFNDTLRLVSMTKELLLRRSYDLAVAKRFTLARNRAPIEIAITEGVDLDLFIESNHLTGDEILLLPQGKQVVVYL